MLHRGVLGGFDASRPPETGRQRLGAMLEKRRVMIAIGAALALFIGLSLGLLGGGGSILTLPILRYVLGMEAHDAIAVSLLVVGTTSAAAMIPHARKGRVRWRTGIVFGLAGMVGAFGAGRVAHFIPSSVLLGLFGLMMMVTALAMMRGRKAPKGAVAEGSAQSAPRELPIAKVIGEGLVVGAVTGLVGAGGGFLVVPALVLLGGLSMEVAVGTSLVVIAINAAVALAMRAGSSHIDWSAALPFLVTAAAGTVIGGRIGERVDPRRLTGAFVALLSVVALYTGVTAAVAIAA